ncbi:MAG: SH3 domain-containing protein [Lachnospiraceae bacterium]|nr:SH3 domain-containing protein [Lachnospiraceae bacterium]
MGEILAQAEQPEVEVPEPEPEEEAEQEVQMVAKTVRATAVVNIRSSDSEEADRIDKAQIGQEFQLLEERGNGWSKVSYNNGEAFIKSDYLEVVEEELVVAAAEPEEEQDNAPAVSNEAASGTVKVKESVKIRKGASTDSAALGTAYAGDEFELVMKQADGWTKIKYKGQTAFVKSDYVE